MPKQQPLRMCVVTRKMLPKNELLRIVATESGLSVDVSQKKDSRGYYISKDKSVIADAKKKQILNKVFKKKIDETIYNELEACVNE